MCVCVCLCATYCEFVCCWLANILKTFIMDIDWNSSNRNVYVTFTSFSPSPSFKWTNFLHFLFLNILKVVTDWTKISVAILYTLSIGIFTSKFDSLEMSRSWSCTFELQISCKWQQIWQTLTLTSNRKSVWAFYCHIFVWPWPFLKVKVKDKVTLILTVNISKMRTVREICYFHQIWKPMYSSSIDIFTRELNSFQESRSRSYISIANISQMVTDMEYYYCHKIGSPTCVCNWCCRLMLLC